MCRFVPTRRGSKRAWCKPVLSLSKGRSGLAAPSGFCRGFRQLRSIQVFGWAVGEASSLPEAQPGDQGDAGLCFGLFSPGSVRPRPLAWALGGISWAGFNAPPGKAPLFIGCGHHIDGLRLLYAIRRNAVLLVGIMRFHCPVAPRFTSPPNPAFEGTRVVLWFASPS